MRADGDEKIGAGLLITSDEEVLLLLRSSKSGHPNTWGLPGGNTKDGEAAITTALRESTEELGKPIPNYTVKTQINTFRGKDLTKSFIVFVLEISSQDRVSFEPELNKEHVEFEWYTMTEISGIPNLHPIVKTLFREHTQELADVMES